MKKLDHRVSCYGFHQRSRQEQSIPVGCVEDTRQGVVPRQERGQKPEKATRLEDGRVRNARRATLEVADAQKQECYVQREEEQEEGDGRAKGGDQEDGGKDPPALERGLEPDSTFDGVYYIPVGSNRTSRKIRRAHQGRFRA